MKPTRQRHSFATMQYHSDPRDGNYATCDKCGAIRFEGDRYTYMREPCLLVRKRGVKK